MRVSMSPSGSDSDMRPSLPARLHHTGDLAIIGELPQLVTAKLELAIIAARAAGEFAAQAHAVGGAVPRQLRQLETRLEAVLDRQLAVHHHGLQRGALAGMQLRKPLPPLVL